MFYNKNANNDKSNGEMSGGKEEEETLIREPVLLKAVSELGVSRIVAGPHQVKIKFVYII